jgi:hypothetical protein
MKQGDGFVTALRTKEATYSSSSPPKISLSSLPRDSSFPSPVMPGAGRDKSPIPPYRKRIRKADVCMVRN